MERSAAFESSDLKVPRNKKKVNLLILFAKFLTAGGSAGRFSLDPCVGGLAPATSERYEVSRKLISWLQEMGNE